MSKSEISTAQAIEALEAAGVDVSSLVPQVEGDGDDPDRLAALEQRLAAVEQPTDPEAAERKLAENFLDALNRSRSPWIDVGGS